MAGFDEHKNKSSGTMKMGNFSGKTIHQGVINEPFVVH
jgi:hypothetical protein